MAKARLYIRLWREELVVTLAGDSGLLDRASGGRPSKIFSDLWVRYRALLAYSSFIDSAEDLSLRKQMELYGYEIYQLIFSGLRNALEGVEELTVYQETLHLPVELAFDGQEFLGLKLKISNFLSSGSSYRNLTDRSKHRKGNASFDFSLNRDAYGERKSRSVAVFGDDGEYLNDTISRTHFHAFRFNTNDSGSMGDVSNNLRVRPDIIHFACHGYQSSNGNDDATLFLRQKGGGSIHEAITLNDLFESNLDIRSAFVFINACYIGREHSASPQIEIASKVLDAGAKCCMLGAFPMTDRGAETFAGKFYNNLFASSSVGDALLLTKRQMLYECGDIVTALSYVLFGDDNFTLKDNQAFAHVANG
jgi:CHAT domain-containing protein